ncbi:hypothetical protein GOFOIKOB_6520 [Methylobacterium tardum]|nr:hypothetical protein GOFOIKOB_6520 [Methylobacterium tardum]
MDAADLGGGEVDLIDPVLGEELPDRRLVEQIERLPVGGQDARVAEFPQPAHDRRADHPTMARNEDGLSTTVHHASASLPKTWPAEAL